MFHSFDTELFLTAVDYFRKKSSIADVRLGSNTPVRSFSCDTLQTNIWRLHGIIAKVDFRETKS